MAAASCAHAHVVDGAKSSVMAEEAHDIRMQRNEKTKKPRAKQSSYMKPKIQQLASTLEALQSEADRLEDANEQLKAKLQVLPAALAEAGALIRYTSQSALSRQSILLNFHQDKFQASWAVIPPPPLWTDAVLRHLESLTVEQYRYLSHDLVQQLRRHLPSAIAHGQDHDSYKYILLVSWGGVQLAALGQHHQGHKGMHFIHAMPKAAAVARHCLHANRDVVNINLGRNHETGDWDGPPAQWWNRVAELFPIELFSEEHIRKLFQHTDIYLADMRQIQRERRRLKRLLSELIPTGQAAEFNSHERSQPEDSQATQITAISTTLQADHVGTQKVKLYQEDSSYKIEEVLADLAIQDSREMAVRATLLGSAFAEIFTPMVSASLVSACYPYALAIPPMLLSFRRILGTKQESSKR